MPNHFHLLLGQNGLIPVSKLISKICTSYSKCFNKKHNRTGHLFQDQFKAIMIDSDPYLLWLSAYIHNNPKTAGLVKDLQDYQYSSYLDYIGQRKGQLCDQPLILEMFESRRASSLEKMPFCRQAYKKFVLESFDKIKERKDLKDYLLD